jgi:valine--pyruvate aminotransferase
MARFYLECIWPPLISTQQLYERLKARGVIVVPGEYFFPGLKAPWPHTRQCLRISYAQDDAIVEQGMALLAEEVARAHAE